MHETFWTLLADPAHWGMEGVVTLVFDVILGGLLWPVVKKHWDHHITRDKREGIAPTTQPTKRVLCISQYRGIYAVGKRGTL